jgi:hypothetical protein
LNLSGDSRRFTRARDKQMPDDAEKRRRADFIVDSAQSFDHARAQARDNRVMAAILAENKHLVRGGDGAA